MTDEIDATAMPAATPPPGPLPQGEGGIAPAPVSAPFMPAIGGSWTAEQLEFIAVEAARRGCAHTVIADELLAKEMKE